MCCTPVSTTCPACYQERGWCVARSLTVRLRRLTSRKLVVLSTSSLMASSSEWSASTLLTAA